MSVMRIQDPRAIRIPKNKTKVLFSRLLSKGKRKKQEDVLKRFQDECFVLSDGLGTLPHAKFIANLTAETAIWAYDLVRRRPYYWESKKRLLKRIFRSTNLRIWQKRKERGYEAGSAATLVVCIIGHDKVWVGSVGDSRAYIERKGFITQLTHDDVDDDGVLTKAIGFQKLGLEFDYSRHMFVSGDSLCIVSDGVHEFIEEEELRKILAKTGDTQESLDFALKTCFLKAKNNGAKDNMSAWLIKRVKN